jgi:hypothetical protein
VGLHAGATPAIAVQHLPWIHRDPFDRLLLVTPSKQPVAGSNPAGALPETAAGLGSEPVVARFPTGSTLELKQPATPINRYLLSGTHTEIHHLGYSGAPDCALSGRRLERLKSAVPADSIFRGALMVIRMHGAGAIV